MAFLHAASATADLHDVQTLLHGVVRRREGLFGWISATASGAQDGEALCIALDALPPTLYPGRARLLADWESLGEITDLAPVWPAFWAHFLELAERARPAVTCGHARQAGLTCPSKRDRCPSARVPRHQVCTA